MKKYNSTIAHVVYASDDKFAEILGVSLVSLYENSKDMDEIVVYVLDSGITDENKQKLVFVCRFYGRSDIVFIPGKNISEKLSMDVTVDRGSLSQYARLFVSSDLPQELDRVLYLDCDIVVKESIRELWNLDLQGKTVGALMDAFSKHYRKNIDLEPDDIMFNSGVMLIDLEKWRQDEIEEKLLKFIKAKNGRIQQGDQGALNAVLSHDTYCFEPRMNAVTIYFDFIYGELLTYRKPPEFYSEEQIREAVMEPHIIHFTTSFASRRPWVVGCKHRYVGEWLKYKKMSPWTDSPLWEDNRPQWKQIGIKVLMKMPRGLAVRFAGLMQAYGRPWMNRVKFGRNYR